MNPGVKLLMRWKKPQLVTLGSLYGIDCSSLSKEQLAQKIDEVQLQNSVKTWKSIAGEK